MAAMLTLPDVFAFNAFMSVADTLVSDRTQLSLPRPVIPVPEDEAKAVVISATVPVSVVTLVAVTRPVVAPSILFRSEADADVPLIVTVSFPFSPEMLVVLGLNVLQTLAADPLNVVALET